MNDPNVIAEVERDRLLIFIRNADSHVQWGIWFGLTTLDVGTNITRVDGLKNQIH